MADATIPADATMGLVELESARPLSESLLWALQSAYYRSAGVEAWSQGIVPSFVTSNAYLAGAYAKVIMAYIRDYYSSSTADKSQPIHIMEVGAGHGKLSFLLVRELLEMWQSWPDLGTVENDWAPPLSFSSSSSASGSASSSSSASRSSSPFGCGPNRKRAPFKFIISDFYEGAIPFWLAHESLRSYFDAGLVDVAVFNADNNNTTSTRRTNNSSNSNNNTQQQQQVDEDNNDDQGIYLRLSNITLSKNTVRTPLIAVCNYIFDTLRQEAYRTTSLPDGPIYEALATLYTDRKEGGGDEEDEEDEEETEGKSNTGAGADEGSSTTTPTPAENGVPASTRNTTTTTSKKNNPLSSSSPQQLDPEIISRLRVVWTYRSLKESDITSNQQQKQEGSGKTTATVTHKSDSAVSAVLQYYADRIPETTFTVPIGGINLLRRFTSFSPTGQCMVLCGDKSYAHEEEIVGSSRDPHVALHGSFSFMVNFHAARIFTVAQGGFSLHTPHLEGFKCSAFVFNSPLNTTTSSESTQLHQSLPSHHHHHHPLLTPEEVQEAASMVIPPWALSHFPSLCYAWAENMDTFGPDNFLALQRCAREEIQAPSLRLAQGIVRMSSYDPDVFFKFKQTYIDRAPLAPERTQADVYKDVRKIYERYYPLQASRDIAFELGRVCMGLRQYAEAISLFMASVRQCGTHHVTFYNTGICLFHLRQFQTAISAFDRAIVLKPDYADATTWKGKAIMMLLEIEKQKGSLHLVAAVGSEVEGAGAENGTAGDATTTTTTTTTTAAVPEAHPALPPSPPLRSTAASSDAEEME